MTPYSLPIDDYLRDPEAGRAQLGGGGELIVVRADDYEATLEERERARFVESVREAMMSLDRGEGISLEDLEAEFAAEDARAENAA